MEAKSRFSVHLALLLTFLSFTRSQSSTSSTSSTTALSSTTSSPQSSSTSATSTTSQPYTHTVSVGYGGFSFAPSALSANVGDIIEYDFYPSNHSVVRAEYGYPCVPYEDIGVDKTGFFSGFQPVDEILQDPPKWSVRVNDTNPIFYYCSAPGSCITYGMVGAINPTANETVAYQQELAKEATFMLQPGEAWPSESSAEPSSSSTSGEEGSESTSAAAATSSAAASGGGGLSGGAIAGIVIGIVALLVILGALFFLFGRNRALSKMIHRPRRQGPADPEGSGGRGSALAGSYHARPKHVSGMTMIQRPEAGGYYGPGSEHASPYLPQYPHMYPGGEPSPSLTGTSDVMSPRSPRMMPGSPSPEQQVHGNAPAYSVLPPELPPEETKGPHELAVPEDSYPSRDPPKKNPGADHYA